MMLGEPCRYETPCGWCWKWDKKCDKKIGCGDNKPQRGLRAEGNVYDDNCFTFNDIVAKLTQDAIDCSDDLRKVMEENKND